MSLGLSFRRTLDQQTLGIGAAEQLLGELVDILRADDAVARREEDLGPVDVVAELGDLMDVDDRRLLGGSADRDEAHRALPAPETVRHREPA